MSSGSFDNIWKQHPRRRGLRRAAALVLLLLLLLQLLPGSVLADEEDDGADAPRAAALEWKELSGSTVSEGKKVENTYILEVNNGTRQGGGVADNVLYFIIGYTTVDGVERTTVLLPNGDAQSSGFEIASAQGNREDRIRDVSRYFGYGVTPLDSRPALGSMETNQFLFTTPAQVLSIDKIQIFGKRNPDRGDWSCQGMRIYQVDTLYGLEMVGWFSDQGFIDFDGWLISSVQMGPGGTTFKWRNSAGMYSITPEGRTAKLVSEHTAHRTQTADRLVFRLDLADVVGAGFESLAGSYAAGSMTKISALKYCEVAALTVRYADLYGCVREVSLPLMINALGQILELMGDISLAEFAQQGDTLAIPAVLPEFSSLTSVSLVLGEELAARASGLVTGRLAYTLSADAGEAAAVSAPGMLRVGGIYVLSPRFAPGSALTVSSNRMDGEANTMLYAKNGEQNQKWILKDTTDGYYQFVPLRDPGDVLESICKRPVKGAIMAYSDGSEAIAPIIFGFRTADGTRIITHAGENTANQKWRLVEAGGGYYGIVSAVSSAKGLTVEGGNSEDGTDFVLWDYDGKADQTFRFELSGESGMNVPEGTYTISPAHAPDLFLEAAGGAPRNNGNIQVGTRNRADGRQEWTLYYAGDGYYYVVSGLDSTMCLDLAANATKDGTNVQLYRNNCHAVQRWRLVDAGDGYYSIQTSAADGQGLEVAGGATGSGSNVDLMKYAKRNNQRWLLTPVTDGGEEENSGSLVPGGVYTIGPTHAPGSVLEVKDGSTADRANVQLNRRREDSDGRQEWLLKKTKDGYYQFVSLLDRSKVLDAQAGGNSANGTNVFIFKNNLTANQKWKLAETENGTWAVLTSAKLTQGLDVSDGSAEDGANVRLWAYTQGTEQQEFILELVDVDDYAVREEQNDPSLHVPVAGGIFTIGPVHAPGTALETASASGGATVRIGTAGGANTQSWLLEDVGNGSYYLASAADPSLVLETAGTSAKEGTNVQVAVKDRGINQQWVLQPFGDGSWAILSRMERSLCLEVYNSGTSSGTNVQVGTYARQTNQRFVITNVGGASAPAARKLTVVEDTAVKFDPIRSARVKQSREDDVSYLCFAVYRSTSVSVALDGATLRTKFTGGSPAQLSTASTSDGISAAANQANPLSLRPYTEGSALIPKDRMDRYLVTVSTDNVPNAGTAADVVLQFSYISMRGKELESSEYELRDFVREFYSEWPGNVEEFAYAYGLRDGGTVQFIIPLQGVSEFTGVSIRVKGQDEWQFSGISIAMLLPTEDGRPYAARSADWAEIEVPASGSYPDGLKSHLVYTRKVDTYPECFTMGTVYEPEEDRPDPEDKDSGWTPGALVQDDGEFHVFNGDSQEVSTKGDVPWQSLRHYMTFNDAQQDLGFTKQRGLYTVGVQVAGNTVNPGNDDCGSKNLFYFRLVFENGNSGCTLANQQIVGDGFRTGDLVQFKIACAQDYGEVTAVQVIPDSQDSNSDIYDKLQIEYISVTKESTDAVSPTWTARVASSSDEGWVGIDYRDPGEIASTAGAQGKTLAELATTFPITETSYSTNLLVSITTASYETGKQFTGGVGMDLNFINAEGRMDPKPISGFDVVGAMNDYGGVAGSHERHYVIGDEAKTETAGYCVSNKNYQFLPGSTDSFVVNIQNVYQLTDMTLFVYSDVVTQWAIKDVDIYQLRGTGIRYLNASGAYAYRYPTGQTPLKVASWSVERINTPLQVYDSLQDQGVGVITFSLDSETIELSDDVARWSSKILKEPKSKDDTLNLILYPSTSVNAANPADYDVTAAIQYVNGMTTQTMQVSTGRMKKGVDSTGRPIFYATGLSAANLSAINTVIWASESMRNAQPEILEGVLQEVRGGVLMDCYPLYGVSNYMYPAVDSPYNSTQRLLLQLSEDTPKQKIAPDESDLAVALYFRSDDPSGLEYRSKYIFLSELYKEVKPGQLLELDYRLGNAGEITGVNLVSIGRLDVTISQTYLADQARDGTILRTQSVQGYIQPISTPLRAGFQGSVAPLTLTLETAEDTPAALSGTKEPIRLTVGYYDVYGILKTMTVENLRTYVQSGDGFAAGGTDTAVLLLPDFGELRWVELEPWHELTESEELQQEVQIDAGLQPGVDETRLATWKLRSLTAKVGLDGSEIYRLLDQRVLEGEPLHVGLSEILLLGTVTYAQAETVSPDSTAQPEMKEVKLSLSTGDAGAVTVDSGTDFRVGVRVSGTGDGYDLALQMVDPATGELERAYIDETHGYSRENLEAILNLAGQMAENAPTDTEKELAQAVIDGARQFQETTGRWENNLLESALYFTPPRNYTGDKLTYRLTVSSRENPAVAVTLDITVRSEANPLDPAMEAWRAVRSAASVTVLDAEGKEADGFSVKFGAAHSQLLPSGGGLTVETHLQDIAEGFRATLRTFDPATDATGPADLGVTFGVSEDTLRSLQNAASEILSDARSSAEEQTRAREFRETYAMMQDAAGSFETEGEKILFAAPRNFTGADLYYRITVTSGRTGEELFTLDTIVKSEPNPLTEKADALDKVLRAWIVSSTDASGGGLETTTVFGETTHSVLLESGGSLTIDPGRNLERYLTRTIGNSIMGSPWSFDAVLRSLDPATGATGAASLGVTYSYTETQFQNMTKMAQDVLGADNPSELYAAAQEVLAAIDAIKDTQGSFEVGKTAVSFTAPRNFTGSTMYYRIVVSDSKTGAELLSADVSVRPEEDPVASAYNHLQTQISSAFSSSVSGRLGGLGGNTGGRIGGLGGNPVGGGSVLPDGTSAGDGSGGEDAGGEGTDETSGADETPGTDEDPAFVEAPVTDGTGSGEDAAPAAGDGGEEG